MSGIWELCAGACDFGLQDETVAEAVEQMCATKSQVSSILDQKSSPASDMAPAMSKSAQLLLKQSYTDTIEPVVGK